jgi:pantetheine-phosphate adenylyltransferase
MVTKTKGKHGVYAGSFDPLTTGHLWMVLEGARLFDRLTVAIGINPDKKYRFSLDDRLAMLRESCRHIPGLTISHFSNLYLIDYARSLGATHILRGIRSPADFEFERAMRHLNGDFDKRITTVFLIPPRALSEVSSSMVKGLVGPKGWQKTVKPFVPSAVYKRLLLQGEG